MSCKAAQSKGNNHLSRPEIEALIDELLEVEMKIRQLSSWANVISMTKYEIERNSGESYKNYDEKRPMVILTNDATAVGKTLSIELAKINGSISLHAGIPAYGYRLCKVGNEIVSNITWSMNLNRMKSFMWADSDACIWIYAEEKSRSLQAAGILYSFSMIFLQGMWWEYQGKLERNCGRKGADYLHNACCVKSIHHQIPVTNNIKRDPCIGILSSFR